MTFSSSDPLATLPASLVFVPADGGVKAFPVVFRTPGSQSVTVSDSVNNLIPGTLAMTVTGGQVPDSIPTLSLEFRIAPALTLCAVGVLRVQPRS